MSLWKSKRIAKNAVSANGRKRLLEFFGYSWRKISILVLMPTLFSIFGLRFYVYTEEHKPIHIHVRKGKAKAKF
jgi:hypothetical protein